MLPASLALLAYLVLGRTGAAQTPTDHHILVALVYPAAYLGVAFGAILSARRVDGEGSGVRQPLLLGRLEWAALVFVPGAALLGWVSLEAQPLVRLLADVCFVVGFALVALEALERLGLVAPAPAAAAARPGRPSAAWGRATEPPLPWRASSAAEILGRGEPAGGATRLDLAARLPALFGSAWNLSLAGAAAAVLVIATLELVVVHDVRPAIYLGSVGLLALVVSRQFITLVDNGRLIDRLRVAAELEARLREVGLAVSRSLEQAEVLALDLSGRPARVPGRHGHRLAGGHAAAVAGGRGCRRRARAQFRRPPAGGGQRLAAGHPRVPHGQSRAACHTSSPPSARTAS